LFESGLVGWARLTVVGGFVLGGWDVPEGFEDAAMVEPVDPLQGGLFDVVEAFPGSPPADDLGRIFAIPWDDPSGLGGVMMALRGW